MSISRFFRRRFWDDERARELESYLQIETDENVARGMDPDEARAAARRKLGNVTRVREEVYRINTITWADTLWRDVRHAVRLFWRSPGFAAVAVLSLALGIGANAAIFQLIDAIALRSLPVDHPEQLAEITIAASANPRAGRSGNFSGRRSNLTFPLWSAIRERQQGFSSAVAWGSNPFDLAASGKMRFAQGLYVSGNFFTALGVEPSIGRVLTDRDDVKGCSSAAAVLSYDFWRREYASDPSMVGRTIQLDGRSFEIVGVSAKRFFGVEVGRTFDVAVPICSEALIDDESSGRDGPTHWFLAAMGRLKPGWTAERASAQLAAVSPSIFSDTASPTLLPDIGAAYRGLKLEAVPSATGVSTGVRQDYGASLWILLATSALILLIACANIANLLLARATAREREMAVRLAIGASRGRLIVQLLTESALLAAGGVALGAAVGQALSRALVRLVQTSSYSLSAMDLDLPADWRIWGFTIAAGVATCLLFGLAPAVRATGASPAEAMKAGGRGSSEGRSRLDTRRMLVVAQVALGFILVVGGLLFVRTFRNLMTVDTGFDTDQVWDLTIDPQHASVPPARALEFTADLVRRIRSVPGVEFAAAAHVLPLTGSYSMGRVILDGKPLPQALLFNQVGPEYFAAFRTPLVAGRAFSERDDLPAPPVAIVNESFVRDYLNGQSPIGHRVQRQTALGQPQVLFSIVGVVKDTKYSDIREPFRPIVFLPYAQFRAYPNFEVAVRTAPDAAGFLPAVTKAILDVNPALLVYPRMLESQISDGLLRDRLMATLSSAFGLLALLLATFGLYGVMSYVVAQRTNEIGVRMALGAQRADVLSMIFGEAGRLLAIGLTVGVLVSALLMRATATLLFGVRPADPITFAVAIAALALAGSAASYLPALRASRLEPTAALRHD